MKVDCTGSLLPNLTSLGLSSDFFTDVGVLSIAEALCSGKLSHLDHLDMSFQTLGDKGTKSLALARSGELKNLAEIQLNRIGIADEGLIALADLQESVSSLLPNLNFLTLRGNSFMEVGVMSLVDALKSGHLDSLGVLDVQDTLKPSERVATALVSAFSSNHCLTVDLKYEWYNFPELDHHREHLIERNSMNRDIVVGLWTASKVPPTISKVCICGKPKIGKTTLSRTLQRSYWESLVSWERRPHVEKRTRGIDVSQLSSKGNKPDENPITLLVWDMAGQEDFHLVHNGFFPDLGFAEGRATTFIVVCSCLKTIQNSVEQSEYWLQYIASSCDKTTENPPVVRVVLNDIGIG